MSSPLWPGQATIQRPLHPPALTVHDLKIHVDPEDEHVTLNAHLTEGGRGQGVGQRYKSQHPAQHRVSVGIGRTSGTEAACDMNHLEGERGAQRGSGATERRRIPKGALSSPPFTTVH